MQPSKYSSSTSNSNTNSNTPTAGTVPPTPHPVIKRELQDSSIGAGAGAATSLNDMTIIKPISTSNSNVDAGDANEFRKTIKSVTTNSNPNLMRQDKDQYTIFLEKKLKSLETLLDLSPG